MNKKFWAILIGGLLFLMAIPASAQTAILDTIADSYKNAALGWTNVMVGYANKLFSLLAAIEIAWCAIVWALTKSSIEDFMASLLQKIIGIGFFYAILLNGQTWIPTIINSFVDAGSNASGVAGMSPSGIFSIGMVNAVTMLEGIKEISLFDQPLAVILSGLSAITIVISFTVIAGQLMVALVESYIVVSAGMLFLGFGGSRWTTDFVQKFIGYAVATGVKLMMLYLIIGIGTNQAVQWQTMLAAIKEPNADVFGNIFTVMGGSLLLVFLSWQIPAMAGAMLAGSPSLTAGAAASTAAVTGAGIIGAGAGVAAAGVGAAKTLGGAASAVSAATKEGREQGLSGLALAAGAGRNILSSVGAVASQSAVQGISGTLGGQIASVSQDRTAALRERNTAASTASEMASSAGNPASGSGDQTGGQVTQPPGNSPHTGSSDNSQSQTGGSGDATRQTSQASKSSGNSMSDAANVMPPTVMPPADPLGSPIAANSAINSQSSNESISEKTGNSAGIGDNNNLKTTTSTARPGTPPDKIDQTPPPPATSPATSNPAGVQTQAPATRGGLQDTLKEIQQLRPPQIPSDAAPQATASIKMNHSQ